ncbi:GNAT family N-acetyltransferase [Metabacillus sp. JX24]|uniref:GNAT family N-acetyltransferase n=1 Tax=Metabacillus sp. JX24 TaxID=3240759 RepID=UPI00350EB984
MSILYRSFIEEEIKPGLLDQFVRYQKTDRVWYEENGQFRVKEDSFTDDWDLEKKKEVIQSLKQCVQAGGTVIGAFLAERMIGFAAVEGKKFGRRRHYLELSYIHVSHEARGRGTGLELFKLACIYAKQMGAEKMYIGAHPSAETQHFYRKAGCVPAKEINGEIYSREPLDLQLEVSLDPF